MKRTLRKLAAPVALVVGVGGAATAMQTLQDPVTLADAQVSQPSAAPEMLAQSFRAASRTALQGVVHVQVEAAARQASARSPFEGTPFEEFFRGQPMPSPSPRGGGSGSGFIISPDGFILTNNHVVDNASRVTVTMTDRRQFEATVVGRDPNTDVAVLKVDAENLPTVKLGDADALAVGDWVLALGYPLSLGETVTAGIVSAKGRRIGIMGQNEEAASPIEHFIQTDAAINPGNSGGPLVNLQGEAIGMNTAIASPTGTYAGYGFAVPIQLVKRVADDLIRYGAVHRPKLGVNISDVMPADLDVFRLSDSNGSVVRTVPAGPAKDAGIQLGDVIVALDGQPIRDTNHLMEQIALRQPGDRVVLDVVRYGDRERLAVTLGQFAAEAPVSAPTAAAPSRDEVAQLGFAAAELTPALAERMGLERSGGVVITQVDPAGSAPGTLRGMVVERVNGRAIESVDDLRDVARGLGSGDAVSVIGTDPRGEQTIINYRIR